MTDTLIAAEFRDTCLARKQCPFCAMRANADVRYLGFCLRENVNDGAINARLWHSYGFCHAHAWQLKAQEWAAEKDGLDVAIIYERVLQVWQEALDRIAREDDREQTGMAHLAQRLLHPQETTGTLAADTLEPTAPCPACLQADESEAFVLAEIADALEQDAQGKPWEWLVQSFGLCLPHLRALLRSLHDEDAIRHLCTVQGLRIKQMREYLEEYVRKHDHRFHSEPYSEAERTSWCDAVALLVGEP